MQEWVSPARFAAQMSRSNIDCQLSTPLLRTRRGKLTRPVVFAIAGCVARTTPSTFSAGVWTPACSSKSVGESTNEEPNPFDWSGTMISKCANPKCNSVFRYLHEGRLFQFEMRPSTGGRSESGTGKPSQNFEYFWLCDSCASRMTLVREPHTYEIVVVPGRPENRLIPSGTRGPT